MPAIDLNADLGEGVGDDAAMLDVVTSANIATGAHAGGGEVLRRAVAAAVERGVSVGAHPSYRDRAGFGRASLLASLRADEAAARAFADDLVAQVLDVAEEARRRGGRLVHVKPHGALYNEAVADPAAAAIVVAAVLRAEESMGSPLAVMTQPRGELAGQAATAGLRVIGEGFADRRYQPDGRLVDRGIPGAVLATPAEMAAQALALAAGAVIAEDGSRVPVAVESLCVHGDSPDAVAAARAVRAALTGNGWTIRAPGGALG